MDATNAIAIMAMRPGYPAKPDHPHMALWGDALTEECTGQRHGDPSRLAAALATYGRTA